ncbi:MULTISPECIES: hypothetical protein [unclassified Imperialibacter]|uniref:hypothetical protein n=1 Tax=unclassified Imperialibacter TaxID=2629706 RepID=UPI0012576FF8|nr:MULTISPECIES: hypothetical protein [unclassified Imperialibacter]CAD5248177.1 conserved hypothetical protein [Imperialibacter sp. 75]CAD5248299.1 conserved hypothetical protein [Imperialibacter sp. 89]VVS97545.1 conserved hypothetical protein [Imperialibacter sp. EC-SDR9]
MPGLQTNDGGFRHQKLAEFLERWPVAALRSMTLEEYSNVGSKDTFCYWIEFETDSLGRIQGRPSNKFGIWKRKSDKPIIGIDFLTDGEYAWYKKYGQSAGESFETIKSHVIAVADSSDQGDFKAIDGIELDNLTKWKIAFLYSNYRLFPVYKKVSVRTIARYFDHPNYEKGRFSDLSTFLVAQKPDGKDFFDFASRHYDLLTMKAERSYYLIGSKYGNGADMLPQFLQRSVIATGFFWNEEGFGDLYGHSRQKIKNWCDKHLDNTQEKFNAGRQALSYFLGLKEGDIIAIKAFGSYGRLTIAAYAQVKAVDGKIYEHDPDGLGHIIHVEFLETGLWRELGLNYANTIHEIIPGLEKGHFEQIFGSYSQLESFDIQDESVSVVEDELRTRINEKSVEPQQRTVSYSTIVGKTHNIIQVSFARHLLKLYPEDAVITESGYVDIIRESKTSIYLYEVKPFNSAHQCVRAGIGQLLDYCHSSANKSKVKHLIIVGTPSPTEADLKFIEFIKSSLKVSFEYIAFNPGKANVLENHP